MARRGIFRRITDALGITQRQPEPKPPPKKRQPPKQPLAQPPQRGGQPVGDKRRGRQPESEDDIYLQEAQRVWDEVAADVANNVEMEEPFVKFIADRLRRWSEDGHMENKEVRAMISWMIINSGNFVTHEDITAILDRIYEAIFLTA